MSLNDTFTSTGAKFFAHQEVMQNLRNGRGQPITTHVMLTDICNHSCAFCSVQARAGDSLMFWDILSYLDILREYGLKSVILSGGGNPILYKCKETGKNFNDVVSAIYEHRLEIGLITNGMPLKNFGIRESWHTVRPETLDKLTWVRISMSGLDHDEREVYVPDINPLKTTLGFSYVGHDIWKEPADPHHGKVSTVADLLSGNKDRAPDWTFEERIDELTDEITSYVEMFKPKYVRLLPNCLEPQLIPRRAAQLGEMAEEINAKVNREVAFVQYKPPKAPRSCHLGYIHPVLAPDGFCYPCDSVVLAAAEIGYKTGNPNHKFDSPWRMCHWSEIERIYTEPIHSLVDPSKLCNGCVFTNACNILDDVVTGVIKPTPPDVTPTHVNFV